MTANDKEVQALIDKVRMAQQLVAATGPTISSLQVFSYEHQPRGAVTILCHPEDFEAVKAMFKDKH